MKIPKDIKNYQSFLVQSSPVEKIDGDVLFTISEVITQVLQSSKHRPVALAKVWQSEEGRLRFQFLRPKGKESSP